MHSPDGLLRDEFTRHVLCSFVDLRVCLFVCFAERSAVWHRGWRLMGCSARPHRYWASLVASELSQVGTVLRLVKHFGTNSYRLPPCKRPPPLRPLTTESDYVNTIAISPPNPPTPESHVYNVCCISRLVVCIKH